MPGQVDKLVEEAVRREYVKINIKLSRKEKKKHDVATGIHLHCAK